MNINLNFKARFAPDVKSGKKRQTIRPHGKRRANPGDVLHLFTGMRTKKCERLGDATCLLALEIEIDTVAFWIVADRKIMSDMEKVVRRDGFKNPAEFFAFFREQYGEGIHKMILYRW